jgi:uncharacterized membrane protein
MVFRLTLEFREVKKGFRKKIPLKDKKIYNLSIIITIFVVCILLCVVYTMYTIRAVQHNNIFQEEQQNRH